MASIAVSPAEVQSWLSDSGVYERILSALARNARMGPFVATSGLTLPYLVAAMTSLLDAEVAPLITAALGETLLHGLLPRLDSAAPGAPFAEPLLCVGMETAGGVLAAQLAAAAAGAAPQLAQRVSFVYLRKTRKASGTHQQLEGPAALPLEARRAERLRAGTGAGMGLGGTAIPLGPTTI